ncbi:MAG: hypothetical protein RRY13_07785, partial [Akkermansia sp.]
AGSSIFRTSSSNYGKAITSKSDAEPRQECMSTLRFTLDAREGIIRHPLPRYDDRIRNTTELS